MEGCSVGDLATGQVVHLPTMADDHTDSPKRDLARMLKVHVLSLQLTGRVA